MHIGKITLIYSNEENLSKILEKCEVDIKFFNESINQQKIKR